MITIMMMIIIVTINLNMQFIIPIPHDANENLILATIKAKTNLHKISAHKINFQFFFFGKFRPFSNINTV